MADPEEVASELSDRRSCEIVMNGWCKWGPQELLEHGPGMRTCPDETRAMCVRMGGCLEAWLSLRGRTATAVNQPADPAEKATLADDFKKCRKVKVKFIRVLEEEWDENRDGTNPVR